MLGVFGRREIAWSLEPGAWSRELGAGSLELGACHIEMETSDGQTSDIRPSRVCSSFVLRRKIAGSLEPGAGSLERVTSRSRRQTIRHQTSDCHMGVLGVGSHRGGDIRRSDVRLFFSFAADAR